MNQECSPEHNSEIILSIIVPVYNVKKYIDDCLQSLARQKVKNVEFIIVDDGSTDGSGKICDQWRIRDNRFIIIHQKNKGTLHARNTGILKSRGKRIAFLDGDDMLSPNAIQEMQMLIKKDNSDIIQFSIDLMNCFDKKQYQKLKNYLKNYNLNIKNNIEIAKEIFLDKSISWNIWDKIYKSSLLKEAAKSSGNIELVSAEDMYFMFIVTYYAKNLSSYKTTPLYLYRVNTGVSTKKQSLGTFQKHLKFKYIIENIKLFLQQKQASNIWYTYLGYVTEHLYSSLISIMNNLPSNDFNEAFIQFYKNYNIIDFLPYLEKTFKERQHKLSLAYSYIIEKNCIKDSLYSQQEKYIAIYYNTILEKIDANLFSQIYIFIKLGYNIILFTESLPKKEMFNFPKEVKAIQLPDSYANNRSKVIIKTIDQYKISNICYYISFSPHQIFDFIILYEKNIQIIAKVNTPITLAQNSIHNSIENIIQIYKFTDIILTCSLLEESFYRLCNINALYLPNIFDTPPLHL